MTFDNYKTVNFTDGQEITTQDLLNSQIFQIAKLSDQIFMQIASTTTPGKSPEFGLGMFDGGGLLGKAAYAVSTLAGRPRQGSANNKIRINSGTLMQLIGNLTPGTTPSMLMYEFSGFETEQVIANGDPSNPRVDIIQMKLETVFDDSQIRAFRQVGVKSTLNCATISTHVNTVVRSRVGSRDGNSVSLALLNDGAGAGSVTLAGNTVTFHYQTGVTTVANFETAIAASTQHLIEIGTIGTPANIFVHPADTHVATLLTGGLDPTITSPSTPTKTRVQCTLNVKQGTPAASPAYPDIDSGWAIVAAVVVPTAYAAVSPFSDTDSATTAALHDQRIPINVEISHVMGQDLAVSVGGGWTPSGNRDIYTSNANVTADPVTAVCRHGGQGRVLSVSAYSAPTASGAIGFKLVRYAVSPAVTPEGVNVQNTLATCVEFGGPSGTAKRRLFYLLDSLGGFVHLPLTGPVVQPSGDGLGPPVWTSGRRCPRDPFQQNNFEHIAFVYQTTIATVGQVVGPVTFWIARGL